jgi:hypothetical protein
LTVSSAGLFDVLLYGGGGGGGNGGKRTNDVAIGGGGGAGGVLQQATIYLDCCKPKRLTLVLVAQVLRFNARNFDYIWFRFVN